MQRNIACLNTPLMDQSIVRAERRILLVRPSAVLYPACESTGEIVMHPPIENLDESIERAAKELKQARRVAVLTGSGVSAESGVPTFRASDGLWEGHRIED